MISSTTRQSAVHRFTREQLLFAAILLLAVFERVWGFGAIPAGLNQDEAYAGYNAWSLLHEGIDSCGDAFPVYFEAWGSGMNVLNSYLMIPFIALFGLKVWVIRLPQLIIGLLTIPTVYGIVRILWNKRAALCAMFLIAVVPWHIMLCRWGLESNLAPGFVTFGLYFFLRGLERSRFLILSALMYGLSLYCYATIWPFVPLIIVLEVGYCIWHKRLQICKELIIGAILLCLMALPLVLFLLINRGILPEVQTSFLSIPRMSSLRDNEISLSHIGENLATLFHVAIIQNDYLVWNTPSDGSGLYYRFSAVLLLISLIYYVRQAVQSIRQRTFSPEIMILIQLLAGVLLGMMININVNRVNIIFLPLLIMIATGTYSLRGQSTIRNRNIPLQHLAPVLATLYLLSMLRFDYYYYGQQYTEDTKYSYHVGYEEALAAADEISEQNGMDIYIDDGTYYSLTLFYEQIPATSYQQANAGGANFTDLGHYKTYHDSDTIDHNHIYVYGYRADASLFSDGEYERTQYGVYTVAIPK